MSRYPKYPMLYDIKYTTYNTHIPGTDNSVYLLVHITWQSELDMFGSGRIFREYAFRITSDMWYIRIYANIYNIGYSIFSRIAVS